MARLFDPLGWAAPVLIYAKIFMQDLWLSGCEWDDPLSPELTTRWTRYRASLCLLEEVRLSRWLRVTAESRFQLHGFSDASERAYAAAVYLRVVEDTGQVWTHLLTARTKVAPLRTQSMPRLELCGALLLARLLDQVITSLTIASDATFAWTDAQVVLGWLHSHASRWKPFVANRVAEVQRLLPGEKWRHVRTSSNPADLATRGISPAELQGSDLWWFGPTWLKGSQDDWPARSPLLSIMLRTRSTAWELSQGIPSSKPGPSCPRGFSAASSPSDVGRQGAPQGGRTDPVCRADLRRAASVNTSQGGALYSAGGAGRSPGHLTWGASVNP